MLRPGGRVRPARPDDAETLIELMRALAHFEDYLDEFKVDADALRARAFGENAQCHIVVAEWEGQIAGAMLSYSKFPSPSICGQRCC
jgi:hypothetical protein